MDYIPLVPLKVRVPVDKRNDLHIPAFFCNILKCIAFLSGCVVYLIHIVTRKGCIDP